MRIYLVPLGMMLIIASNAYAYTGGNTDYHQLPSELQPFAAATLQLVTSYGGVGQGSEEHCSGILVGNDKFLTAAHCITKHPNQPAYNFYSLEIKSAIAPGGAEVFVPLSGISKIEGVAFYSHGTEHSESAYGSEDLVYDLVLVTTHKSLAQKLAIHPLTNYTPTHGDMGNYLNVHSGVVAQELMFTKAAYLSDDPQFLGFKQNISLYALGVGSTPGTPLAFNWANKISALNDGYLSPGAKDELGIPAEYLIIMPPVESHHASGIISDGGDSGGPLIACSNNLTHCQLIGILSRSYNKWDLVDDEKVLGSVVFNAYIPLTVFHTKHPQGFTQAMGGF